MELVTQHLVSEIWILGFRCSKHVIVAFSLKLFSYEGSESEIFRVQSRNPEAMRQKILDLSSQYFRRYDLWKVVIFQAREFHLKEVIVGKFS